MTRRPLVVSGAIRPRRARACPGELARRALRQAPLVSAPNEARKTVLGLGAVEAPVPDQAVVPGACAVDARGLGLRGHRGGASGSYRGGTGWLAGAGERGRLAASTAALPESAPSPRAPPRRWRRVPHAVRARLHRRPRFLRRSSLRRETRYHAGGSVRRGARTVQSEERPPPFPRRGAGSTSGEPVGASGESVLERTLRRDSAGGASVTNPAPRSRGASPARVARPGGPVAGSAVIGASTPEPAAPPVAAGRS
jgi:hypothetical protein